MLIVLGIVWGGSFFFARVAVAEIHPLTLVLFRVAIAAVALHVLLAARGTTAAAALPYAGSFLLLALLNNVVPFSLIFAGQTELGAGLAAVLNATTPFWTALLANALTNDEKLSWNKVLGIALGIAGTAVTIGPDLLDAASGPAWPKFALIGASLSYAFALMLARRLRALPPLITTTAQLTGSTLIMIPVVLIVNGTGGIFDGTLPVWGAVLGLALVSTAFAYLLYFRIIASAGATNASLVTLLVPVSAILLGTLILGESLLMHEVIGMLVIALGLLTIDGRVFRLWTSR